MNFHLESDYTPSGDQPAAIEELCSALEAGVGDVTLLGVTGSGKTFTMANVIARLQRPALILSHNKTLAAQLYGEFKSFFPKNAVEYFVSYYDYYQPEAYIPSSDTYIEKDLSINDQIEKLRLSAASALLSGRRDVIVISSVSCLYGIGNPEDFHAQTVEVSRGQRRSLTGLLYSLVDALYNRTEAEFTRGNFRVRGDVVDVFPAGSDQAVRIEFFGDEVDAISIIDPVTGAQLDEVDSISIFPATNFVTSKEKTAAAVSHIQDDLVRQMEYFQEIGRNLEASRLKQRVEYDLEMIKEMGYCPGIENYSRYFDGRSEGQRPFCLLDPPVEVRKTEHQVDDLVEEIRKRADKDERILVTTLTKRMAEELDEYLRRIGIRVRYIHSDIDTAERVEIIEDFKNGLFDVLVGVNLLREGLDIPSVSLVAILDADKEGFLRTGRALTQTAGRAARNVNGLVIMYADKITPSMEETIRETNRRRSKQMEYNKLHNIVPRQVETKSNILAGELTSSKGKPVAKGLAGGTTGRYSAPNSYDDPTYIPNPSDLGSGMVSVGFGHDSHRTPGSAYADGHIKADLAGLLQDPVIRSMSRSQIEKLIEEDRKIMKKSAAQLDFTQAARYRDEMWALEEYLKVWKDTI